MNAPLILKDFSGTIEVTQDAWELKRHALEVAKPIARVETPEQQLAAVAALRELKAVLSGMEQTRKAVKAPVLDLGKKIDTTAKNFLIEVEKQWGRLTGLVSHYQRQLADAKAKEEQKIEKEQRDARALKAAAFELRDRAEDAIRNHADEAAIKALRDEATKLEEKAFDLEMNAEVALVPAIDKPRGLVVRNRINFQVLDAIIFVQAYPQYFKWHEDTETLKLDRMGILDELNREDGKGLFHMTRFPEELAKGEDRRLVQPAGLRVYEEIRSHVR